MLHSHIRRMGLLYTLLPMKAVAILLHTFCSISQGLEYCVVPDAAGVNFGCPLSDAPRHTLQYYAANSNFTSNATFHFLHGEHALDSLVELTNVVNLSLVGVGSDQDSNKVVCGSDSAGFFVQDFVNFRVESLSFLHCGAALQIYRGAFILSNGSGLSINHVTVFNSSGYGLAAFSLQNSTWISNSVFSDNRATDAYRGGNVMILFSECLGPSHLTIDQCKFLNGYNEHSELVLAATGGLTVQLNCMHVHVAISNSLFDGNQGYFGANLYIHFIMLTGNFIRVRNITASNGHGDRSRGAGAFVVLDKDLPLNDPISCGRNSTQEPHHLMEISEMTIVKNTGLGALFIEDRSNPKMACAVHYVLIRNSEISETQTAGDNVWWSGTAVRFSNKPYSWRAQPFKIIQATFQNVVVSASDSTLISLQFPSAAIFFQAVLNVTFINCTFENNKMGAITALASNLVFQGNNTFRNNSALFGTGIMLLQHSYMFFKENTHITFADNHASSVGGAIYVDSGLWLPGFMACFYQVDAYVPSDDFLSTIRIDFINNTADYAGSSLYIPEIDCHAIEGKAGHADVFKKIFKIQNTESDPSAISSNPSSVCLCSPDHHMPNCSNSNRSVSVYPGQDFSVRLAVVGSMDGTVPGAIEAFFPDSSSKARFGSLQDSQTHKYAYCNNFTYTVYSTSKTATFSVGAEHISFNPFLLPSLKNIIVNLRDCPVGFALHDSGTCVCDPVISRVDIHCFINNQSILRPANTWIGFMNDIESFNCSADISNETGVIFSEHCPYGCCSSQAVYLNSSDPDSQCVGNRTGLLCGQCVSGYSLTLGGQRCSKCSNMYLFLLFPLAASGLVLVALLFALNLTVTQGSINGLIFYANVVAMSQSLLYPGTSSQLYVFIAWVNLDLGINACFYHGLDSYAETWLQFVFPLYLWAIIITIVIICNKFPKLAKVGVQNAVKVLATLFLISYTKLQRTLVTIFSFTTLRYPSGAVRYVWLYDANVEFLKGKHIYLYVAGMLVLVVLIVPYTFGLALFQYLQACSGRRAFWWVNGLKPVFDAYAGPYKDRYRMWTGLLLVTRTLLAILFSLNITGSPDFNHFTIFLVSLGLLMLSARGIYVKWQYDFLEAFFYVHLAVFSGGLIYASHNNGSIPAVADYSIGTALLGFVVIVGHRIFSYLSVFRGALFRRKGYDVIMEEQEKEEEQLFQERDRVVPALSLNTHCT